MVQDNQDSIPFFRSLQHIALAYGIGLIILLFSIFLVSILNEMLGNSLQWYMLIEAFMLAYIIYLLCMSAVHMPNHALILSTAAALIGITCILGFFISTPFFDISYDGQAFHQETILQLATNHWDPMQSDLRDSQYQQLVNSYPRESETDAALIVSTFGSVEGAKLINIMLMLATLALIFALLSSFTFLSSYQSAFLALLIACSPTVLSELFTFYNDSPVYAFLISCLVLLGLMIKKKNIYLLFPFACSLMLLVNTKFSAIPYILICIVPIALILLYTKKYGMLIWTGLALLLSLTLGITLLGYNPYITNLMQHGSLFYPLQNTAEYTNITRHNIPKNYTNNNALAMLFLSSFSTTTRGDNENPPQARLKLPFTFTTSEISAAAQPDPISGGFGPLFSGMLCIACAILCLATYQEIHTKESKNRTAYSIAILSCIGIILSCSINPISSEARYVPQFFITPFIIAIAGFSYTQKYIRILCFALIIIASINCLLIAGSVFSREWTASAQIHQTLSQLHTASLVNGPIIIKEGVFDISMSERLQEAHIDYSIIPYTQRCSPSPYIMIHTDLIICRN